MNEELETLVKRFIEIHKISCAEAIYQNDNVIEAAYEFIETLCNKVGYYQELDD